jgi:hypothetical protein
MIVKTLLSLSPDASWALDGPEIVWEQDPLNAENYIPKNLIWNSKSIPMPTKEQIETRMSELQAIADSLAYQEQRKQEYPPLADLADAIYWQANGDTSKMTTYLAQVAAVKDRYPKGTV